MRRDIDDALHDWPFEPDKSDVKAREVRTRDGRSVLQVRVELGILQLEAEGRPDGLRPHGFATYLDYLRYRAAARGQKSKDPSGPWTMSATHCTEADREFIQFFHRRVAWLSLQRFDKAIRDADHTLGLMDFVSRHGPNEDYITSHERLRGLVLFHRAQAAAALALERRKPEEAVEQVQEGIASLQRHEEDWVTENPEDELPDGSLVDQLKVVEVEIRKHFQVPKTLREQLDEAVALEDYERAARLRDQIRARTRR